MSRAMRLAILISPILAFVSVRADGTEPPDTSHTTVITAQPSRWQDAGIGPRQIEADWLHTDSMRLGYDEVAPEQDAAGGCDGIKNGQYGFHTGGGSPWWQVDLGVATPLDRVLIYNRCDSCPGRAAYIMVLLADDAQAFRKAYQFDGTNFFGYSDNKPLAVSLNGASARYVRVQVPGNDALHLDEVEVYPVGSSTNIALGKPATQSSVSSFSVGHVTAGHYPTAKVVANGLKLAANLRSLGVDVEADAQALQCTAAALKALPANAPAAARERLHLDAHWAVRRMALRNPLLDFDTILFTKAAPTRFPHMSDQFYGWWSRPGGGVYLLQGLRGDRPRLQCLTAGFPTGSFLRPDLSYDGRKVLFAYCKYDPRVADLEVKTWKTNIAEEVFYHVFEMNIDGSGCRQLTHGRYDDFDARYLPGGEIVFVSTRKGQAVQCSKAASAATEQADLPDSYVRCGGGDSRPVAVFTLHAMDADGRNIRPLSAFENFEWTPAVANDGRILYSRWDYIDRFNGPFFSLWSTNPDGSNPQLVYGNFTVRPQVVVEARPIPNSENLVFTASAHHSIIGGALVRLDRRRGTEDLAPLTRLTPEVSFPETEGWPATYYANPYPLSEDHYLVGWSDHNLPPHGRYDDNERNPVNAMGLYLYDAFGNLNLVYRDPDISSTCPIPVRPRPVPPVRPSAVAWDGPQEGRFMLQDVYQGLTGIARGAVKQLRIVAVPPKTQPNMNWPNLGVSGEDPGKYLLGTVPVEADGSAFFRVPSGVPVLFQALDADGLALQTMRTLTYVWPRQTLACVGCHEARDAAPPVAGGRALAALREPSRLTPGPEGSWPWRFDRLVQPVLDTHCVACHSAAALAAGAPAGANAKTAAFDLTASKAYQNLLMAGGSNLYALVRERDRSVPGDCPARQSKLLVVIKDANHQSVRLDPDSLTRLTTWMDVYAQPRGDYSDQQEAELRARREQWADLLAK